MLERKSLILLGRVYMDTISAKYIRYWHTPGVNVVVTPETKLKALYDEYVGSAYTSVK